jgi:Fe-S cluster assembly protein SufD
MEVVVKNNLISSLTIAQDVFASSRYAAKLALEKLGLPISKTEEYKHSAISRLLEKNFQSLELTNNPSDIAIDPFLVKGLDAHVVVFINGIFNEKQSTLSSKEVTIKSLEKAVVENKDVVETHLSKYADVSTDAFVALNTASWNYGLFIEVKNNIVVDKPIIVHHIADGTQGTVVTANRNLVVLGTSSTVSIIEKYDSVGEANFSTSVNEFIVGENAGLTYKLVQNDEGKRHQFNHTVIHQKANSRANCFTLSLNGKLIRNNLHLILDGEGIDSHLYGLYLLNGDTQADNHTVVDHRKPNSVSNEMYKGVLDGNSKGIFNGKIFVRPGAQKTNAFQSNRNVILSDNAAVHTKPQLEIWADDVKCSHGCTSGQLDEEALFYLQSRGINKKSAQSLLLYAFVGEVIEKITNEALRTYIDSLVSERLNKNF